MVLGAEYKDESYEVRRLLSTSMDPVRFALSGGFQPDPWQARFLWSPSKYRMLNCSRQIGKSTTVAYGVTHRAVYRRNSLILLLSPGERQSGELMRKVYDVLDHAPDVPPIRSKGMLQIEFANGSRILALPGKEETVRGYSAVDILCVDEASRVPDELFFAVQPMLAVSKGEMWTLSSPFGSRGWWYQQQKQVMIDRKIGRKPQWDYFEVPATEVPSRLAPEFLASERRSMGEWWFMQEYMSTPSAAPIWMGDLSFQPIGHVHEGDEVIGWAARGPGTERVLQRSKVLGVHRHKANIAEIRMASGREIVATSDHRWLTMSQGNYRDYYGEATIGRKIAHVINPTQPLPADLERNAAWLGGLYDGEGTHNFIAQDMDRNPVVWLETARVLEALGFSASYSTRGHYFSKDGKQGYTDFLNWARPVRRESLEAHILTGRFREADTVVNLANIGEEEVVCLETDTGNYVVWGYASSNCKFMDPQMAAFGQAEVDAAVEGEEVIPWHL